MTSTQARLLAALAGATLAAGACKPPPNPKGNPAPELVLDKVLNAPIDKIASWKDLRGKVVVLEFFATWCDPCVENIPHLNKLAENLKDEDIRFITITDESEEVMAGFLKKNPISGWVAFDPSKKVFNGFRVRGRPRTVIVGKDGTYLGDTYPAFLKEKDLRAILAGNVPEDLKPYGENALTAALPSGNDLMVVRFGEASGDKMGMSRSGTEINLQGLNAEYILELAVGLNQSRIQAGTVFDGKRFDAHVRVPKGQEHRVLPLLKEAVAVGLNVTIKEIKKEAGVFILKKADAAGSGLQKVENTHGGSYSTGAKTITASGWTMGDLAAKLESPLDRPVIDETGLKGRYRMELEAEDKTPEAWRKALREQLGLKVVEGRRTVRFLEVKPR